MKLADAHCHLQDPRIGAALPELLAQTRAFGVTQWIVNATREADWPAVSALAESVPGVRAAFGLHPWWLQERTPGWQKRLVEILRTRPNASIGETGLDLWMPSADLEDQKEVLRDHLGIARMLERPVSIHCLRAWPQLLELMKETAPAARGFLLHSYSGPAEMIGAWTDLGAFFSFSPAFLNPKKAGIQEMFRNQIPLNRILIETDAPDMAPPANLARAEIPQHPPHAADGGLPIKHLNHPGNLILCAEAISAFRNIPQPEVAQILMQNFHTLFGEIKKSTPETFKLPPAA